MKPLRAHIAVQDSLRLRRKTKRGIFGFSLCASKIPLCISPKRGNASRTLLICFLFLMPFTISAQAIFGNEWIEHNVTYYKFNVTKEAIHRIPASAVVPLQGKQNSKFNLFNKGQVIPIYVHDSNNNQVFDATDYIEFFGKPNDGSFDTNLYSDPATQQPNPYVSLFNDTAVYFLAHNTQQPNTLISNIANDLSSLPAREQYFMHTVRPSTNSEYCEGTPSPVGNPPQPVYECIFDEGEGFMGAIFNVGGPAYQLINAPLIYPTTAVSAHLNANIVSLGMLSEHILTLKLNTYQFIVDTFIGFRLSKYSFDFPVSQVNNYSPFQVFSSGRATADRGAIAMLELTYPHEFTFPESKSHYFLNAGAGARYIQMYSFIDNSTNPILYDLTNNLRITGTQGSSPLEFKLPAQSFNVRREIFVTSQSASNIITVSSVVAAPFTNYFNSTYQGDYVIITHPKLRDENVFDHVGDYAKYRGSVEGGNHEVAVAMIDQLYDQFAYGIKKHPLAIRNFISFALDEWTLKPEHLFIIGKGREYVYAPGDPGGGYDKMKYNAQMYAQCLVPTFGYPGSDPLLTATNGSIVPRVAVGRLSAEQSAEVGIYLEKVKAYERVQAEAGDPHQTTDEKLWMKRVMHMGGGEGAAQQAQFVTYLKRYEGIIEDTLYGGDVHSFYKTSTGPIQDLQSEVIRDLINTGVSLITFFGHSSPGIWDIKIDNPETYTNFERYHLLLSNGCFTGNIYQEGWGLSERFVFAENKAAVGFISTIALSSSSALDNYSNFFYEHLSRDDYGNTIGTIMRHAVEDVQDCCGGDPRQRTVAEEMTLHGDPGLRLNIHSKPDYVIEPQMVSFEPATLSIEQESFNVKVVVTNLGRAVDDSVNVMVTRFYPNPDDGSASYSKRIRGTRFTDTVEFTISTGSTKAFGLNKFCVKVDPENGNACDPFGEGEAVEISETNNELGEVTLNITSEDIFPIHPYEFAIVPSQPITLKASTANVFAGMNTYRIEIDTTELFNSPLRQSTVISQQGGVVTWTPPSLNYIDSVVYYWRTGIEGSNTFHNSSFIYLYNEYPGWNQSHYYQYLKDDFDYLELTTDREFKFIDDTKTVGVYTGTWVDYGGSINQPDEIGYTLNSDQKHPWKCNGDGFTGGLVLAVFDSASGTNWLSKYSDVLGQSGTAAIDYAITSAQWNPVHKNIHCKARDLHGFDFPTIWSNPSQAYDLQRRIVAFIDNVPAGNYILAYSVNLASYANWDISLVQKFRDLGSKSIDTLINSGSMPWAFFAQKGHPASAKEKRGSGITSVLDFYATFTANWNQGTLTTPLIGPAHEWGSVHWRKHALEQPTSDQEHIEIIGVTSSGSETVLYSALQAADTTIEFIEADEYPYIRLRLDTRDDPARTPTQLDYWRVLYKKVPEAALSPNIHLTFHGDTILLGEDISLSVACENVTGIPMDSLLVKYTLQSAGFSPVNEYVRYDSLHGNQTMNLDWLYDSDCNCLGVGTLNTLVIEVNPVPKNSTGNLYDQPEQFHFNNIGVLMFKTDKDRINPLLDVTFDGVHIMDGDIVSAYPEILIRLKDENKFLLLNDTSLISIYIIDPNNNQEKMSYDGTVMQFYPAGTGANNTAEVHLRKEFMENGTYTLLVQAKDRSRNISGNYGIPQEGVDYRISFEVIREAMLTNVLNYPNPFTSFTRFVFTLTGIQPPDFFKIQIMTVSGKVVRELTQADLGYIHVGKNITEYGWDGTDEYGDPLGNGLYLYRVVANIGGEAIEKMENTSVDKYFKSGFGKMYLAR